MRLKYGNSGEKCFMVAENPGPVICERSMSVNPHLTFSDCPALDFLLVPGGEGTRREVNNPSGKSYCMMHQVPQTPEYVRKMA
ncbi:MAG: type 1 glutamine amidotransferase family protein [Methanosarcina sp.]|nr:hypothetical protein BGV40_14575 [Methanosarcina sp. Ant1]